MAGASSSTPPIARTTVSGPPGSEDAVLDLGEILERAIAHS